PGGPPAARPPPASCAAGAGGAAPGAPSSRRPPPPPPVSTRPPGPAHRDTSRSPPAPRGPCRMPCSRRRPGTTITSASSTSLSASSPSTAGGCPLSCPRSAHQQRRCAPRSSTATGRPDDPSTAGAGEVEGLAGEQQPRAAGFRVKAEPFLHRRALVRVEPGAIAGRDECVDPLRGKLQHQLAADQHHEDPLVEAEGSPAETAAAPRRCDAGQADKLVNQVAIAVFGPDLAGRLLVHDVRLVVCHYSVRSRAALMMLSASMPW